VDGRSAIAPGAIARGDIGRGAASVGGAHLKYEVAVRTLCEFTAKRGNLDMRFTPSPSAIEGMAGHRTIASRRGSSFQTELTLAGDYGLLRVRGRADGYDPEQNRLEEFKTYRGDLNRMPENHRALHWAQLRIYGVAVPAEEAGPREAGPGVF